MHVLFLAPDTSSYNHRFLRALKAAGARVSAFGYQEVRDLSEPVRHLLDHYERIQNLLDTGELTAAARRLADQRRVDRVETIDEPLIGPAAQIRRALGLDGLTPEQAHLCRDKAAMKQTLRDHGIPCARSAVVGSADDARRFVEAEGYPVILKPRDGFGTLNTFRVESPADLDRALGRLKPGEQGRTVLIEEFIDGHEGFYDTLTVNGRVAHDFIAHYYPGCLEALQDRGIAPQIAVTNRVDAPGYQELREVGARVIEVLGLDRTATHMEWFYGTKGLRISEIGARPAGERIWDLHARANDFDIYGAWVDVVLHAKSVATLSRRLAAGSVQVRPDRDGRVRSHEGMEAVVSACGEAIYEFEVPRSGTPTQPLEKGWLANTWFRLTDPDYDRLRTMMTFIGQTVKCHAD